jgi:hypothetical protein
MPAPPVDLATYVPKVARHVLPLGDDAAVPIRRYRRAANDAWNLLLYVDRNLERTNVYGAAAQRHMRGLHTMVLLTLLEAFERFLKELAARCVDTLVDVVADGRFDAFQLTGGAVALHAADRSVGDALCDSLVWCDCDGANDRFRRLLADPWLPGAFYVFPKTPQQLPEALQKKHKLMSIAWQLRHSIVHNNGILTPSDALKLRIIAHDPAIGPGKLSPQRGDVWYTKLFLDDTAQTINAEVAQRVCCLLSTVHASDTALFVPMQRARALATVFDRTVAVAGVTASP